MTEKEQKAAQRRESFRSFLKARDITKIKPWALRTGVSYSSIMNFLQGRSQSLSYPAYKKIANYEGVELWQITGDKPEIEDASGIWVTGHVQAGSFQEATEWLQGDWFNVNIPISTEYSGKAKGLQVRGDSMNEIYPDGSVVIWVELEHLEREPKTGERVIVYCYSAANGVEATVKEYREGDGQKWLWPRSTNPKHQQPLSAGDMPTSFDEVVVKGIVIGSYRPE